MDTEVDQDQKGNKIRRVSGRWFRKLLFSFGNNRGYRSLIILPLGLSVFIGYQLFIFASGSNEKAGNQVGLFYGERLSGTGHLVPEMIRVPSGSFDMGSEDGENDELPVHKVKIDSFELGRFEVTNAQWKAFCDALGKSYPPDPKLGHDYFLNKPNHPVLNVSWIEAQEYCNWLSGITGRQFRLPTEAEWEYAAQGATIGCYSGIQSKNNPSTAAVGSYKANKFGFHDMLGNVWEWCEDWYDPNYFRRSSGDNPGGSKKGNMRVLRGGSWGDPPILCRVSNRIRFAPSLQYRFYGLRIAASAKPSASIGGQ